jgi:hypothetical protein
MNRYKHNKLGKVVIVSDFKAAGEGNRAGITYVIYKDEGSDLDFSFVMGNRAFHETYTKIEELDDKINKEK